MVDTGEPDLAERFEQEYAILASSRSDRLVRVFDHGQEVISLGASAFNHYWYTMERCDSSGTVKVGIVHLSTVVEASHVARD